MPGFVASKSAFAVLEDIIDGAKKICVIVSPYIDLDEKILQRLRFANERGVKIIVLYRKGKLKKQQEEKLVSLANCHLVAIEFLHAKCY